MTSVPYPFFLKMAKVQLIQGLDEFTERFGEREAAFAVEATAGWRYVVEELDTSTR